MTAATGDLFGDAEVKRAAGVSACGVYRYWLWRRWDPTAKLLPIIMLNPSTADGEQDDPTIRRCISFAQREGFGGIRVMNLFGFRATSPADMMAATDPIGPDTSAHLDILFERAAAHGTPVLAAWGAYGGYARRNEAVQCSAKGWGASFVCLGTTAAGHPRHPLYVKGDQPFVPFGVAV